MSQNQSQKVQVTPTLSPEHYKMIKRIARLQDMSIQEWILRATEGDLRSESEEMEGAWIPVGFGDEEITEVFDHLVSRGAG